MAGRTCPQCTFLRGTTPDCNGCEAHRRITKGLGPAPGAVTAGSLARSTRRRIRPLAGGATTRAGIIRHFESPRVVREAETVVSEAERRVRRTFAPTVAEARREAQELRHAR